MNKTIKFTEIVIICLVFSNCNHYSHCDDKDDSYSIAFFNNSEKKLYVVANNKADTIYSTEYTTQPFEVIPSGPIAANSDVKFNAKGCWKNSFLNSGKNIFFVFEYDTLQKYRNMNINTEVKDSLLSSKILKRYDITFSDIKNMGWIITYP